MMDWLTMGGYGEFVWGSYLVTLVAIVTELMAIRARSRRAMHQARAEAGDGYGN